MKTLLEQAKNIQTKDNKIIEITGEQFELAVAWANNEVSLRQIQEVLGLNNVNSSYVFIARCFKYKIVKQLNEGI